MSFSGGILLGIASVLLLLFNGQIAGVSGISKGIIFSENQAMPEKLWRIFFVSGLVLGGIIISLIFPEMTAKVIKYQPLNLIIAGLLVGVGTSIGNGCTSGHGICGLGRKSFRSLISVITFMSAGILTVYFMSHFFNTGF
jgi:uncharacterized membrane protein YedE/YeeE